jgi:hypothetical protein
VVVSTSRQLDVEERRRLASETSAVVSKDRLSREVALARIRDALTHAVGPRGRGGALRGRGPSPGVPVS